MQSDDHERARLLADQALVAGISPQEQRWLTSHMAECPDCAGHAAVTTRILAGLGSFSFDPDPAMTRRVRQTVEMHARRNPWRRAAWAAAAVVLLAAPVYRGVRERRLEAAERQDSVLMRSVDARLSQTVPAAMQPLQGPAEETK